MPRSLLWEYQLTYHFYNKPDPANTAGSGHTSACSGMTHPMPFLHRHFHYEHKTQKLLPRRQYHLRLLWHGLLALLVIVLALGIGVLGYRFIAGFGWIDALLDASMILGGMGPVGELHSNAAKIFASFYALFSGLVFIGVMGILLAAPVHRFLHRLHLEKDQSSND